LRINNRLDDKRFGKSTDLATLGIDINADITGTGEAFLRSGNERRGNRLNEDFAFDTFFTLEIVEHGDKFGVHENRNSRRAGQEVFQDSMSGGLRVCQ
jgi:hypothetical protein